MSTKDTSGPAPEGAGQPEEAPRVCWNEDCRSADPRRHTVFVAANPKEPWEEVELCTECAYVIKSCALCAYVQPVGVDDDDDTAECRRLPPPWEPVAEADWCDQCKQESALTAEELASLLSDGEDRGQLRHLRAVGDAAASTPPEQEEPSDEGTDEG